MQERKQDQYKDHVLDGEGLLKGIHSRLELQGDISASRQKSMELLIKIFPSHSTRTLELFLQSCRDNVVETIECILSSQRACCPSGMKYGPLRAAPMDACTVPTMRTHSSPFLHTPVPRDQAGMPLANVHACTPGRIYQSMPLPPPLLIKPKTDSPHFRFPTPQRAIPSPLSPRNCGTSKFCTYCGNKMMVYDQFCANCGKNAALSPS